MKLGRSPQQALVRDAFAEILSVEASPARVRATEPGGFGPMAKLFGAVPLEARPKNTKEE